MNSDPFDPWYVKRFTEDGDKDHNPDHWDLFTLSYDQGATEDAIQEKIEIDQIDDWIEHLVCIRKRNSPCSD